MSLVLNTNEQAQGDVLSNRFLWTYPDFKSILFFPNITDTKSFSNFSSNYVRNWQHLVSFWAPNWRSSALNVNWTEIPITNQILQENILLNWTLNWWNLWNVLKITFAYAWNNFFYDQKNVDYEGSVINAIRLWFSEQLEWSWIVWKKITANFWFSIYSSINDIPTWINHIFSIVYRIWLLHADWSITYWERVEDESLKAPAFVNSSSWKYRWASNKMIETETDWLEYIDWDRLIIEIWEKAKCQWMPETTGSSSSNASVILYFWSRWNIWDTVYSSSWRTTTNIDWNSYLWSSSFRWRPIQISIE